MKRVLAILLMVAAPALGQIENPPQSGDIADASTLGRSLLTASNAASARTSLGLGASWLTDTNTPVFNYVTTNARFNAPVTDTNFVFGGVGGVVEVEANNNHAVVARASDATDGAAFYGRSASGAPAGKFVQTNAFVSPAVSVWRTAGDYAAVPTLLVHGDPVDASSKAVSVMAGTNEVFWVKHNGQTSLWLGNATSDPASPAEGQMYFNTSTSAVRIFANGQWRTLN